MNELIESGLRIDKQKTINLKQIENSTYRSYRVYCTAFITRSH